MKTETVRIAHQSLEHLDPSKSKTQAVSDTIDRYAAIKKYELDRLKGYFTKQELAGLISAGNSHLITNMFIASPDMYFAHIQDSIKYEYINQQYSFNTDQLLEKISKMTPGMIATLQEEIEQFWNTEDHLDLNDFMEKF